MEFQIIQVLTAAEVQRFLLEFQTAKFVDGRATASGLAKDVKQNLQVDRSGSDWPILDDIVFSAVLSDGGVEGKLGRRNGFLR